MGIKVDTEYTIRRARERCRRDRSDDGRLAQRASCENPTWKRRGKKRVARDHVVAVVPLVGIPNGIRLDVPAVVVPVGVDGPHGQNVQRAICATALRILSGLYLVRDLKVHQRVAPILFLFWNGARKLSRLACLARFSPALVRGVAHKPWPTRQNILALDCIKGKNPLSRYRRSDKETEGSRD